MAWCSFFPDKKCKNPEREIENNLAHANNGPSTVTLDPTVTTPMALVTVPFRIRKIPNVTVTGSLELEILADATRPSQGTFTATLLRDGAPIASFRTSFVTNSNSSLRFGFPFDYVDIAVPQGEHIYLLQGTFSYPQGSFLPLTVQTIAMTVLPVRI